MMPFGIILLNLFFICYNFWGLERVNPFQPPKLYHMKDRIKHMMLHGITGLERVNTKDREDTRGRRMANKRDKKGLGEGRRYEIKEFEKQELF
jgi:hypothetical protein